MSNDYDQFEDFLSGDGTGGDGGGILECPGLKDYEGIETRLGEPGAQVILNCRSCNTKKQVVVEWPELVVLASNEPGIPPILPPNWQFSRNNKTAFISMRCPKCGADSPEQQGFAIHMTPEEAKKHVSAGVSSGLLSPQYVQSVQHQIAVRRSRGG